jgi:hypothetical protein
MVSGVCSAVPGFAPQFLDEGRETGQLPTFRDHIRRDAGLKSNTCGGMDNQDGRGMAGDEEKPIRVVDRRMFTPDGELRPDYQAEEPNEAAAGSPVVGAAARPPEAPAAAQPEPPASPPPAAAPGDAPGPDEPPAEPRDPGSDFASLVRSLATTAYSALGLLPDPSGVQRRDAVVARQMIDWLALEGKTRSSFEVGSARILYELRLPSK